MEIFLTGRLRFLGKPHSSKKCCSTIRNYLMHHLRQLGTNLATPSGNFRLWLLHNGSKDQTACIQFASTLFDELRIDTR
jgi:hypothetical protein